MTTAYKFYMNRFASRESLDARREFDENSKQQLKNIASLPFIHRWIAAMPDVHLGKGATIAA